MEMSFHITWFESNDDMFSKGERFKGESAEEALKAFRDKYPNAIFLSLISSELVELKTSQNSTHS